jgi:TonB family C-terminal domain
MDRSISLFAASLILAQPVFAADQASKAERDRQMSEIVFQNYPPRALEAGEEGPVFFIVTLDNDAHPTNCQVTHGSGHPLLDQETCDLIVQHAVFGKSRDEKGNLVKVAEGVVNWTLPGHTPAPINMSAAATNSKPEPQVCKKTVRVGTLAGFERTCMTPSEWAKQSDEMKQPLKEVQGKGFSVCSMGGAKATGLAAEPGGGTMPAAPSC